MRLERVKRWQWMFISLVIGGIISAVKLMYPIETDINNSLASPRQLENALLSETKGIRNFKDIVVYPWPNAPWREPAQQAAVNTKGRKRTLSPEELARDRIYYVVTGKYTTGHSELQKDGKYLAVWRPYIFVERAPIYRPTIRLESFNKAGVDYAKKFNAIARPTVLDFLRIMKEAKGVEFRYAWWREPAKGTILWMGLSFVGIGLIWPFIVSLLSYGTLFPPPEEKGIDLSKVRASSTTSGPKSIGPTEEDMDELQRMEAALKAKIAESDTGQPLAAPATAAAPAPIKQLTATTTEVAHVDEKKDEKAFGAAADDFYPTERKGRPKSE